MVQILDGRFWGKLKDGKYGIRGLTIVILIDAGIAKMSGIFKTGQ